jgi:DNA-binding response OmpR family regulator
MDRILYVEDNPINAALMEAVFDQSPQVDFEVAVNGADALDAVRRRPRHLLLIDGQLPDIQGVDLLAKLRAESWPSRVPAVFVSANADEATSAKALAAGFDECWPKPIDIDAVLARARALLAGSAD